MAALAAEAEALLSYEISAACVEFFAPLAGWQDYKELNLSAVREYPRVSSVDLFEGTMK